MSFFLVACENLCYENEVCDVQNMVVGCYCSETPNPDTFGTKLLFYINYLHYFRILLNSFWTVHRTNQMDVQQSFQAADADVPH